MGLLDWLKQPVSDVVPLPKNKIATEGVPVGNGNLTPPKLPYVPDEKLIVNLRDGDKNLNRLPDPPRNPKLQEPQPKDNRHIVPVYFYDRNEFISPDTVVSILNEAIRGVRNQLYPSLRIRIEIDGLHPTEE